MAVGSSKKLNMRINKRDCHGGCDSPFYYGEKQNTKKGDVTENEKDVYG